MQPMSQPSRDDLLEHLTDASEPTDLLGDDESPWAITSDAEAAWAMRKYQSAQRRIEQAEDIADREKFHIDQWLKSSTKADRDTANFFSAKLVEYAQQVRAADPDRKSLDLPGGKVYSRKVPATLKYDDEDAFLWWARNVRPDLLSVKTSVNKQAAKKALEPVWDSGRVIDPDTGEAVPGVVPVAEYVSFRVEVDG